MEGESQSQMYELFHSVAIVLMQITYSFLLYHHMVWGEQIVDRKIRTPGHGKSAGFHGFLRETNDHPLCKWKNEGHLNLHALRKTRK